MQTAKVFKSGNSQAVRLPKKFRFKCDEITITKLGSGILLKPIQKSWMDIYKQMTAIPDFVDDRSDIPAQEREQL